MMAEPTTWPFCVSSEPLAWKGRASCTAPVKASGSKNPVKTVKSTTSEKAGRSSRSISIVLIRYEKMLKTPSAMSMSLMPAKGAMMPPSP